MRSLLLASILVVLVAASAPGMFRDWQQRMGDGQPAAAASVAPTGKTKAAGTAGPRQVEIRAQRDGHFYVDAEINLRPVRLMVDTGASVVALRKSDAEAVGIRPAPAAYEHPVSTANGTTYA